MLSYLRSVLTRKFRWELGSVIRAMDIATTRIGTITAIILIDIIDPIGTTVITTGVHITGRTGITDTIGIITIIGTKLM